MQSRVTDVKPEAIIVQGPNGEERVACHTKVWSAGVQASPLAAMLAEATGAGTDRAGHVEVLPTARCRSHPEVFVVGDMMSLNEALRAWPRWRCSRASTRPARSNGASAATPRKAFVYRDLGSMATISRFRAIVSFKGIKVGGFIGWLMWAFVHLTFLRASRTAGSRWASG